MQERDGAIQLRGAEAANGVSRRWLLGSMGAVVGGAAVAWPRAAEAAPPPSTLLDVRAHGAVGDGVTDDTAAFNDALTTAMGAAGKAAIYVPSGAYRLADTLRDITVDGIWLLGDSADTSLLIGSPGQTLLKWGDATHTVTGGGVRHVGFRYDAAPLGSTAVHVRNGFAFLSDIALRNVATFFRCGEAGAKAGAYLESVRGHTYYAGSGTRGYALVDLVNGGGVWMHDWSVQVGTGGSNSPAFPRVEDGNYATAHMLTGAAPSTVQTLPRNQPGHGGGINFVQILTSAGTGVDTVYMSNVLAQQFTCGIYVYCRGSSGAQFVEAVGCAFDNCGQDGVSIGGDDSGGWTIANVRLTDCVCVGWDGRGISLRQDRPGYGYLANIEVSGCYTHDTGLEGIYIGAQCRHVSVMAPHVLNPNRFTGGTAAAIRLQSGAQHVSLIGGSVGTDFTGRNVLAHDGLAVEAGCSDFTVSGTRAAGRRRGLNLGAGCDRFSIAGNTFRGGVTDAVVAEDTLASRRRRVHGNAAVGYAGAKTGEAFAVPASGTPWQNRTPFVLEIHVHGGAVSAITKDGRVIPSMTSGSFRLDPGASYALTYTAAPAVAYYAEQ